MEFHDFLLSQAAMFEADGQMSIFKDIQNYNFIELESDQDVENKINSVTLMHNNTSESGGAKIVESVVLTASFNSDEGGFYAKAKAIGNHDLIVTVTKTTTKLLGSEVETTAETTTWYDEGAGTISYHADHELKVKSIDDGKLHLESISSSCSPT